MEVHTHRFFYGATVADIHSSGQASTNSENENQLLSGGIKLPKFRDRISVAPPRSRAMPHCILLAHPAVNLPQRLHRPRTPLIPKIHAQQSKLLGITKLPLEIIQQRPVIKSPHVHPPA